MKIILILAILWSLLWKGIALWKAARNNQKKWFLIILILQSLGILEILYIYIFQREREEKAVEDGKIIQQVLFNKNFKEFLLKEYENIWTFYRNNYEIRDRWVKFYFLITASALAFVGAFLKYFENPSCQNVEISSTVSVIIALVFLILSFLGAAVFAIELVNRRARREMFNALNLIRKGFLSNYPMGKDFVYFPIMPKERAFGRRDFVTIVLSSMLALINFWTLVWFAKENKINEYLVSYFYKSFWWNMVIGIGSIVVVAFIILYFLYIRKIKKQMNS